MDGASFRDLYDPATTNGAAFAPIAMNALPTGALGQTMLRNSHMAQQAVLTSGRAHYTLAWLRAGAATGITFCSGSTALSVGTNQWAGIYSTARAQLTLSTDKTNTAWAANSLNTFTISYTIPADGLYYIVLMVAAATPPSLIAAGGSVGNDKVYNIPPILTGWDATNTGLTNPASAPATAAALTVSTFIPYAYVA
jgi:hypothetical protein